MWTYRRANDIWQVKHLNGFTFVSAELQSAHDRSIDRTNTVGDLRVKMCLSRCSSRVNDCPQYVQKTMLGSYSQVVAAMWGRRK